MSSAVGKAKGKLQPEDVDDATVNPSKRQRTDIAQVTSTAAETFANDHISDFELTCTVKNVVSYVGGYIVRKLKLNDSYSDCLALLTDKSSSATEDNLFIHFKVHRHNDNSAFGSLHVPSSSFEQKIASFATQVVTLNCWTSGPKRFVINLPTKWIVLSTVMDRD